MVVVQLGTIEEFIDELRSATPERILDETVRWVIRRIPEQKERVTFQVSVWATAIERGNDADYLLEFGDATGSSASVDSPAEIKANGVECSLRAACKEIGLTVKPGKIEVY